MTIAPRRTVFSGRLLASGLWFDTTLIGEARARQRIAAAWQPGSLVRRYDNAGLLLTWPAPRWVNSAATLGTPVIALHNATLATAPLTAAETKRLPARSLALVRGGELIVTPLAGLTREDPGAWIDVSATRLCATMPPAAPPPLAQAAAAATSARVIFGVGEAGPSKPPGALRTMAGALLEPGRSWRDRARELARRFAFQFYSARRHSEYLRDLVRRFEDGDLHDALRHAIPLSKAREEDERRQLPLREFKPRPDLSINTGPRRAASGGSLPLEEQFFEYLRERYRAAYERLLAQGKIEEAAFVLTELLEQHEEAVALLEQHSRLEKAAQLAEARGLAPAKIVRLWFLTGNRERAVLLARRYTAFAAAVLLLESQHPAEAAQLRRIWAEHLAASGNLAGAFDAVWPVPALRPLAAPWLTAAFDAGGVIGARAFARMAATVPESFPTLRARLAGVLDDQAAEAAANRWEIAKALRADQSTPAARALLRPLARALCADVASGAVVIAGQELEAVVQHAQDAALRADLPGLPAAVQPGHGPFSFTVDAADAGRTPIEDARWLPGGRLLVALGEAGCLLLDAHGQLLTHFAQPAGSLVISTHGTKALAVARRGEVWRVARLDLVARTGSAWCVTALESFAASFDGAQWFVAIGGTLHALDTTAEAMESIWSVDTGFQILNIDYEPATLALQLNSGEVWRYQLPGLVLRSREPGELAPCGLAIFGHRADLEEDGLAFELHGASYILVGRRGQHLTVADDRGRLLVFHLTLRRLLHNLRL
ncbi:MAG: hypothetical protein IT162_01585 [Bryobacterales bacterium]|nr:hypothetical protein [Bryobacterales bacterium]